MDNEVFAMRARRIGVIFLLEKLKVKKPLEVINPTVIYLLEPVLALCIGGLQ